MALTDYIAIRGAQSRDKEVFQGIGAGGGSGDDGGSGDTAAPNTPISDDTDLADEIWEGQNEKLEHESAYCDQLQAMFEKKQERVTGIWDKLLDVVEELIGGMLAKLVMGWVFMNTGNLELTWLSGFLTEIGVEWGLEALQALLTRGNELLEGIKDENAKLLAVEKSRENFEYRETVLARHRDDIRIILEQIRMAEKQIEITTQLDMKALLDRLSDLALRDDTVEFGDVRLHSRGKVVEF